MVNDNTIQFDAVSSKKEATKEILTEVYNSLIEKGYNPVNQLVGYFISGDPTYITNYNGARALIRKLERDDILEEVLEVLFRNKIKVPARAFLFLSLAYMGEIDENSWLGCWRTNDRGCNERSFRLYCTRY